MESKPHFTVPYLAVGKCQEIMDKYRLDIYQQPKESTLLCQVIQHLEEELCDCEELRRNNT